MNEEPQPHSIWRIVQLYESEALSHLDYDALTFALATIGNAEQWMNELGCYEITLTAGTETGETHTHTLTFARLDQISEHLSTLIQTKAHFDD